MIHAFPKIFALGTDYIQDIWMDQVEITEKVDGSQFAFGKLKGELVMRSKGKQMWADAHDNLFNEAVDYALSIEDKIPDGVVLYGEYLKRPKHNVLVYDRIPRNHIMLFGSTYLGRFDVNWRRWGEILDLETVPILAFSQLKSPKDGAEYVVELLELLSVLGGSKIEGVVVKNYARPFLLGGQPIPLMMGKFVSERFKEKNKTNWEKSTAKSKWELFKEQFRTEARWVKAVQHLGDSGELEYAPRDIGKLIKEVQNDLTTEELESIKEGLWKIFGQEIIRKATAGFPEWYKKYLLERPY